MRAYTTEHATALSRQSRTLGLGDVNPNDIPSDIPLNVPGTFYMQDFGMDLLSPSGAFTPTATPIVPTTSSSSTLLIGLGLLALIMISGGHR